MEILDMLTADKHGFIPNPSLIGVPFKHSGNGKTYTITGYVWLGDTDEWAVTHTRSDSPVTFSRTVANFFGDRAVKRYDLDRRSMSPNTPYSPPRGPSSDMYAAAAEKVIKPAAMGKTDSVQGIPARPGGPLPIPSLVSYHPETDTFYDADGENIGVEFYLKWKDRCHEFPVRRTLGKRAELAMGYGDDKPDILHGKAPAFDTPAAEPVAFEELSPEEDAELTSELEAELADSLKE